MGSWIVGIDLGTSSTKFVALGADDSQVAVRLGHGIGASAVHRNPEGWMHALSEGFSKLRESLDLGDIVAISLTGQTNTYVFADDNGHDADFPVVGWSFNEGGADYIPAAAEYPSSYFLKHISMPHPALSSYPLPRFLWLQAHRPELWRQTRRIMQPKDYVYHNLTGRFLSDPYTWRGLANRDDLTFHRSLLADFGIPSHWLPELHQPWEAPAPILAERARALGLNHNVHIYLGCNDFYAATIGVGATKATSSFDITGTSEHIGQIVDVLVEETSLVASPHFHDHVHYGATANSGRCTEWLRKLQGERGSAVAITPPSSVLDAAHGPLFLPYLRGERAPIFDNSARGMFFGLTDSHSLNDLFWAVLEGVAFSIYHIWQEIGPRSEPPFLAAGGTTNIWVLNQVKANLFDVPFDITEQKEAAALGAALIGSVGEGWNGSLDESAEHHVHVEHHIEPDPKWTTILRDRFSLYRDLYPALKSNFAAFTRQGVVANG